MSEWNESNVKTSEFIFIANMSLDKLWTPFDFYTSWPAMSEWNESNVKTSEFIIHSNMSLDKLWTPFDFYTSWPAMSEWNESNGGGGGNRTHVRKHCTQAPTCLVCLLVFRQLSRRQTGFSMPYPSFSLTRHQRKECQASLLIDTFSG